MLWWLWPLFLSIRFTNGATNDRCPCPLGRECSLQGKLYSRRRVRIIESGREVVLSVQLALKVKNFTTYSFTVFPNETSIDSTWLPTRFDTKIAERLPPKIANITHFIDAARRKSRIVIEMEFDELNMKLNSSFEIRVYSVFHRGCNQLIPLNPPPTTIVNFDCRYIRGKPCAERQLPLCNLHPSYNTRVLERSTGNQVQAHFEFHEKIDDFSFASHLIGFIGECRGKSKEMFKGECTLQINNAKMQRFCLPNRPCSNYENSHQLVVGGVKTAKIGVLLCLVFDKKFEWPAMIGRDNSTVVEQILVGLPPRTSVQHLSRSITSYAIVFACLFLFLLLLLLHRVLSKRSVFKRKRQRDPWEIEQNEIDICYEKCLGTGRFSNVFAGYLSDKCRLEDKKPLLSDGSQKIAVKLLANATDAIARSRFLAEMHLRKTIAQNPKLVNLIGTNTSADSMCILLEYCSNGDLHTYLRSKFEIYLKANEGEIPKAEKESQLLLNSNDFLKVVDVLRIAIDVCSGVEYLHSQGIVHRNIRSSNILLTGDFSAKISGIASVHKEGDPHNQFRTHSLLPIKFMAPESLRNAQFTRSSDVWMLGVLIWELFTVGGVPYPLVPAIQMWTVLRKAIRLPQPLTAGDNLYALLRDCWSFEPGLRPRVEEIRRFLQNLSSGTLSDEMLQIDPTSEIYDDHEEVMPRNILSVINEDEDSRTDDSPALNEQQNRRIHQQIPTIHIANL